MVNTHFFGDPGGGHIFFFNLQGNVGRSSPNRLDDVQLVQLGIRASAADDTTSLDPDTRSLLRSLAWGPPCSGAESDPLVIAIRRFQDAVNALTKDGHVSVVRTTTGNVAGSVRFFHLVNLQASIIRIHKGKWPLINTIEGCPSPLKEVVSATMSQGGTPGG